MLLIALLACHDAPSPAADDPRTWEGAVNLDTDTTVPAGSTLIIAPGAVVTLAEGVSLLVEGELIARGTEEDPVVFTGDAQAPWGSIVFAAGASDAVYEGVDTYSSGSILENAVVEHARRAVVLQGASPYLRAVRLRENLLPGTVETIGGAALLISDGARPRVRDCVFEANTASTFAFGGAIYVDRADPILQDDVFTDNTGTYGGAIATDQMASPIVGSTFEGNQSQSDGGAISLVSSVSALLANTIVGNHALKDGAGVHVCVDCDPHAAPYLYDNVITDNLSEGGDPDGEAAGVGAAFLGALRSNDLHDNLRDGVPSDFGWFNLVSEGWPDWVAQPALADVWWGSEDPDAIAEAIWDGADSASYGVVTVAAPRSQGIGAPSPRAVIASRKLRYQDADEEVPVFLTLYNPGPETRVNLRITRNGLAFDGELDYPGASASAEGWTLDMPADSVWFQTIDDQRYDGVSSDDITWEAALSDPDSGAAIGDSSVARYLVDPAEGS